MDDRTLFPDNYARVRLAPKLARKPTSFYRPRQAGRVERRDGGCGMDKRAETLKFAVDVEDGERLPSLYWARERKDRRRKRRIWAKTSYKLFFLSWVCTLEARGPTQIHTHSHMADLGPTSESGSRSLLYIFPSGVSRIERRER